MNEISPADLAKKVKEDSFINFIGILEENLVEIDESRFSEIENLLTKFEFEFEEQKYGIIELITHILRCRPLLEHLFESIIRYFISKHPEVYQTIINKDEEDVVKYLVQIKVVDPKDTTYEFFDFSYKINPLIKIINNDNLDLFQQKASEPDFDINISLSIDENQNCLKIIDYAARIGAINCFKYLYINNATLDRYNSINYAIEGGNSEIIHLIEQKGIEINESCILKAIEFHHNDILDWLLERFPDHKLKNVFIEECVKHMNIHGLMYVDEINPSYVFLTNLWEKTNNIIYQTIVNYASKYRSFVEACRKGNIDIVKKYLCNNVDVNCLAFTSYEDIFERSERSTEMSTAITFPLIEACIGGQTEVVRLLLADPRIDVNKNYYINEEFTSFPLLEASSRDYYEIVKLLLQHESIDINKNLKRDDIRTNSLLEAIHFKCTKSALLLLEQKGIDINYSGYGSLDPNIDDIIEFRCPIIEAITSNNSIIVEKLLCFPDINLDFQDYNIDSPFIQAIISGNFEIVKSFLDHGKAQMDDIGGETSQYYEMNAYQIALKSKNIEIADLLMNHPATKNLISLNKNDDSEYDSEYD